MAQRRLIIGILIVVLACVGGYIVVSSIEKKVESTVREELKSLDATVEKVSYSVFSKKLEMNGLAFSFTFFGQKQTNTIRQAIVMDPDMKAFDPATPGRPLVAKSILIKGLEEKIETPATGTMPATQSITSFEEISLENWRQNVGKVIAEYKKASWSEAFFAALLDYSLDSLTYHNAKGQLKQGETTSHTSMERLVGKNLHDELLSFTAENMFIETVVDGKTVKVRVKRSSVTDLRLPFPAFMSTVAELSPQLMQIQQKNPDAPLDPAAAARLEPLFKTYLASTPFKNISLEGLEAGMVENGEEIQLCTLKSYSNSLNFSFPYNFEMSFQDLFIADFFAKLELENEGDMAKLLLLGMKDLTLSADFKLRSPAAPELATLGVDVKIKNVGGFSGSTQAQLPLGGDLAKLAVENPEIWLEKVLFGKTRISYTDDGLMPRALLLMADEAKLSPELMLASLTMQILAEAAEIPIPGLAEAATGMLKNPGSMTLSINPAAPLAGQVLLISMMMNPSSVGLEVKTTPGSKGILEAVAALQAGPAPAENKTQGK